MDGRVQDRLFPDQHQAGAPDRVGLAYRFLSSRAEDDFSLDELSAATGWRMTTVLTYRSRLYREWWERTCEDRYRFPAAARISEDEFRDIHSQARFRVPTWYRRVIAGTAKPDLKLEFRPPLSWDETDRRTRRDLLRDCLAFAGSGGGTIIIGVSEPEPGRYLAEGLSEVQIWKSVPTAIAADLCQSVSGSLSVSVRVVTVRDRWFLELAVAGHDGVPPVPLQSDGDLCRGHIYHRTSDGQSRPVETADELRRVLGEGRSLLS